MKLLIIIDSLNFGGAEKQAVTDANLLQNNGFEVSFLYSIDGLLKSSLHKDIKTFKLKTNNQLLAPFYLYSYLVSNKFDIIHSHMFWAEKVSSIPAFLTNHPLVFNEHGLGKWRKWYHSIIMRLVSVFANKVACSCNLNCEVRIEKGEVPKRKLITLYNSFESTIDPELVKNKKNNKIIGFVGRFHDVKQLDHFIKIAELLTLASITDFKILLVGDGEIRRELESQVLHKNLSSYFIFAGFQSDTSEYFKQISLFILPSRIEALSVALIEAQAYGIPSLAYDVGGNKEIIISGETGFIIEKNNVEELFEKICLLFENDILWTKFSKNAFQNAHAKFSNQNRLRNLTDIYNQIKK